MDIEFTKTEYKIISCIAKGMTNNEIASSLFMSSGTIRNYITKILQKTGLKNRSQVILFYLNYLKNENT